MHLRRSLGVRNRRSQPGIFDVMGRRRQAMQYREAVMWLDQCGGRWAVHATSAAGVVVVASLGSVQVETPANCLSCECVDAAVAEAVDRIKHRVDSDGTESSLKRRRLR
jgi:hypothetical protein